MSQRIRMSPLKIMRMRTQSNKAWAAMNIYPDVPRVITPTRRPIHIATQMPTPRHPKSRRQIRMSTQKIKNGSAMARAYASNPRPANRLLFTGYRFSGCLVAFLGEHCFDIPDHLDVMLQPRAKRGVACPAHLTAGFAVFLIQQRCQFAAFLIG